MSEPAITVVDPGLLSTVQDLGRIGYGHAGVSPSGAVDGYAARAANRLVANADGCAVIETTLNGMSIRADRALRVAVTGADADLTVAGRRVASWRSYDVEGGDVIRISPARRGLRSYVAFAGGVDADPVLGSRSTDVGAGFGGRVLAAGDRLRIGTVLAESRGGAMRYPEAARWDFASPAVLRALRGPDAGFVGAAVMERLFGGEFVGSPRSGRQALRLDGSSVELASATERTSFGVCAGCVQIAGDGKPIVLLAEHQTTGGYPVALCVIAADVPRAAQIRPGDPIRFAPVGFREAADALADRFARLASVEAAGAEVERGNVAYLARGFFEGA